MTVRRSLLASVSILAISVLGCGGSSVSLVPVEGKLLVDGMPLDGVVVNFVPESSKEMKNIRGGTATTTATGTFEVTDLGQNLPGLPPGKYFLAYSRPRLADGSAAPAHGPEGPADPGQVAIETLPPHLLSPDKRLPGNMVEIPASGNTKLDLSITTAFNPALMGPG